MVWQPDPVILSEEQARIIKLDITMKNIIIKMKKLGLKLGMMKALGYEAEFTCAFRERKAGKELMCGGKDEFLAYEDLKEYWYADPLIYQYGNREYVFMEAFERKTGLGRIAAAKVGESGWEKPQIIIEEEFHLSFPVIFEYKNVLYMIPETSTAGRVILYQCREFPFKWEKKAELLHGRKLVDIVPVSFEENAVTFLGSECEEGSLRVRFQAFTLYFDEEITAAEWEAYNASQEYTFRNRNGGFMVRDQLVLQKSTPAVYGYSILFGRPDGAVPRDVSITEEIRPADIKLHKSKIKHIIGTHTYSLTENYELIDVQYMRFNKMKWINRYRERRKYGKTTTD